MKVTPLEIRQKTFEKKLRGYDKDEVDAFLQALSYEWERLNTDFKDLKTKLSNSEKDLEKLKEVESSLYKALKTAEDTGANVVDQANKSAELHIRETQINAEVLLNDAKNQAKDMIEEAEEAVKTAVDQVKQELLKLEQEYKTIENQRDNLLHDLKSIASDTLERANRTIEKTKEQPFKLPNISIEAPEIPVPTIPEPIAPTPTTPEVQVEVQENDDPIIDDAPLQENQVEFEVNTSFASEEENVENTEIKKENIVPTSEDPSADTKDQSDEQSSFFDQF